MTQNNQQLTHVMNVIQEANQTLQQAQASGNAQQMYEAQRRLYLAKQSIEAAGTQMDQATEDEQQQFQQVQEQLNVAEQSISPEGLE